jgi:hypothetical protein
MIKLHEYLNTSTPTGQQLKEKQNSDLMSILLNQAKGHVKDAKLFLPKSLIKMSTRKIKDSPTNNLDSETQKNIDDLKCSSEAFYNFVQKIASESPKNSQIVSKKNDRLVSRTHK